MKNKPHFFIRYSAKRAQQWCLYLAVGCLGLSCKKFVEVAPPPDQPANHTVFESDASAISAVLGIYIGMMSSNGFAGGGAYSVALLTSLSSDELTANADDPHVAEFYTNQLSAANPLIRQYLWGEIYANIYCANMALAGLDASHKLSTAVKHQLLGEVKFIRAFCNFYLTNLFGDIPIVTSADYGLNNIAARHSKAQVYRQILKDLQDAEQLLDDLYLDGDCQPTTERVRPNKWVAKAFLARVYLFMQDFTNAEAASSALIERHSSYRLAESPEESFLSNSSEAIWQLQPVLPGQNTNEAIQFLPGRPSGTLALSPGLVNCFEEGDHRKQAWMKEYTGEGLAYYYPYKYKLRNDSLQSEYSMIFRLAEQYLIRSEARARLNNISGAKEDLNIIRSRSRLASTTATTREGVMTAIENERQREFFTEWGHRWLDLKRWGRSDNVLPAIKGNNWNASDALYPIPFSETQLNRNLVQNPGY